MIGERDDHYDGPLMNPPPTVVSARSGIFLWDVVQEETALAGSARGP